MDFYAAVKALLRENGFELHRPGKGSHEIWRNEETSTSVTVPRHLRSRHTANAIMKDASVDHKF